MFNPFNKKSEPAPETTSIRDILFGDMPITQWPADQPQDEPWLSFARARQCISEDKGDEAIRWLQGVLAQPGLESRHYLQAWHFLSGLGVRPSDAEGKHLYGVVVEVTLHGPDIVAVYEDHTARYFNYSGKGIVWERPENSLDATIDRLFEAGRIVVAQIGPWEGPRPAPPGPNQARINFLTPSGLHFGQASFEDLSGDPLGAPVLGIAGQLMQELIAKTERA